MSCATLTLSYIVNYTIEDPSPSFRNYYFSSPKEHTRFCCFRFLKGYWNENVESLHAMRIWPGPRNGRSWKREEISKKVLNFLCCDFWVLKRSNQEEKMRRNGQVGILTLKKQLLQFSFFLFKNSKWEVFWVSKIGFTSTFRVLFSKL